MKKFIIRLLLFSAPVLVLLIIPITVLWHSKENFHNIDKDIAKNDNYLIGYSYDESNYLYLKWKRINTFERSEVLTVGSSRTLQFRKEMFTASFYNAGYTVTELTDFKPFLESIDQSKYPKYLIIALDQWMFNEKTDNLKLSPTKDKWQNSFSETPHGKTLFKVYIDLFHGKYNLNLLNAKIENKIGLNAFVNNKGFRNDGSMFYGNQVVKRKNNDPTAEDYNFKETLSRIKNGNKLFQFGSEFNLEALKVLNELFAFCRSNNIHVIAYLPPFADKVNLELKESGNYLYMTNIEEQIFPLFNKYGFELYNFTTLNSIGSNDKEMLDGFHGGELIYIKMLIRMLESKSALNMVCNIEALKNDVLESNNPFLVYNY